MKAVRDAKHRAAKLEGKKPDPAQPTGAAPTMEDLLAALDHEAAEANDGNR